MSNAVERSSRVGRSPVALIEGVTVEISGQDMKVTGPKGSLEITVVEGISVAQEDGKLLVSASDSDRRTRGLHGMTRSLLQNMVDGVSKGFQKDLEVKGVGYRAQVKGTDLVLYLGRSHEDVFNIPAGIKIEVGKDQRNISITGIDRQLVGEVAASIRALRPPEPYKGKGVRYVGEYVRMKEGKAGK
ncbi:MAG: 50S ribosomal protein L6 [Myxococcales bacterium]|nr:50S ribosomal protein L6 [Myxococcales bacterium]